jgi:hypothetical protein
MARLSLRRPSQQGLAGTEASRRLPIRWVVIAMVSTAVGVVAGVYGDPVDVATLSISSANLLHAIIE